MLQHPGCRIGGTPCSLWGEIFAEPQHSPYNWLFDVARCSPTPRFNHSPPSWNYLCFCLGSPGQKHQGGLLFLAPPCSTWIFLFLGSHVVIVICWNKTTELQQSKESGLDRSVILEPRWWLVKSCHPGEYTCDAYPLFVSRCKQLISWFFLGPCYNKVLKEILEENMNGQKTETSVPGPNLTHIYANLDPCLS